MSTHSPFEVAGVHPKGCAKKMSNIGRIVGFTFFLFCRRSCYMCTCGVHIHTFMNVQCTHTHDTKEVDVESLSKDKST